MEYRCKRGHSYSGVAALNNKYRCPWVMRKRHRMKSGAVRWVNKARCGLKLEEASPVKFDGGIMKYIQEHAEEFKKETFTEGQLAEYLQAAFSKPPKNPIWLWRCPICEDWVPVRTLGKDPEKGWFIECEGDHEPKRFWAKETS